MTERDQSNLAYIEWCLRRRALYEFVAAFLVGVGWGLVIAGEGRWFLVPILLGVAVVCWTRWADRRRRPPPFQGPW